MHSDKPPCFLYFLLVKLYYTSLRHTVLWKYHAQLIRTDVIVRRSFVLDSNGDFSHSSYSVN